MTHILRSDPPTLVDLGQVEVVTVRIGREIGAWNHGFAVIHLPELDLDPLRKESTEPSPSQPSSMEETCDS